MVYLKSYKIFESLGYDNSEITNNDYNNLLQNIETLDFSDREFNTIRRFFAQYNTKIEKVSQNKRMTDVDGEIKIGKDWIIIVNHRKQYFAIHKLEDEWYTVYSNTASKNLYFKCDQMGGLIEVLSQLMSGYKTVDADEYILAQDNRRRIATLKDSLIKKIRTLGLEDLENLSNQLLN